MNYAKSSVYVGFGIGTLVWFFPHVIRIDGLEIFAFDAGALRWAGVVIGILGALVYFTCARDFVARGNGTPAFWDPPRGLVLNRWFRTIRNPMYAGVALMNVGQGVFFGSTSILAYALAVTLGFHVFVVCYEEPTLRRHFGERYGDYCRRVPRWFPRIKEAG